MSNGLGDKLSFSKFIEAGANEEISNTSTAENEDNEGDDDLAEFHASAESSTHPAIQPRWPTRVFAAECVRKLVAACHTAEPAHFNLSLAKDMQMTRAKGWLIQ